MSAQPTREEIESLRRALRKTIYGVLFAVVAAIAIGIGTLAYAGHLDDRQRAEAREQAQARAAAAEQTRQLVCQLAMAQAGAFEDATSEPGRKSRDAWLALVDRFNCA